MIFVLVFVSRDSELDQNLSGDRKKFSSDLNEFWYVGRGRIQGQGQGHSREVDHQSPTGLIFDLQFDNHCLSVVNLQET